MKSQEEIRERLMLLKKQYANNERINICDGEVTRGKIAILEWVLRE